MAKPGQWLLRPGVVLLVSAASLTFAAWKQEPLSSVRERTGRGLSLHTRARDNSSLSDEGRILLSKFTASGERGDWRKIQRLLADYQGRETPVFNSALHFAHKSGQYHQGASIYRTLCERNVSGNGHTFTTALKIFAKLEDADSVRKIWAIATEACELDEPLAAARIDAAAAEGDVQTAANVLDEMNRRRVNVNEAHVNSAIRACWEAKGCSHNAARFLYDFMLELGLRPEIATFSCLIGAYHSASLQQVLGAYAEMQRLQVPADLAFAETYLCTVLQKPRGERWTFQEMVSNLRQRSPARLAAARAALQDFRAASIKLTSLSALIRRALEELGEAKFGSSGR